jgi:hypothetical protein
VRENAGSIAICFIDGAQLPCQGAGGGALLFVGGSVASREGYWQRHGWLHVRTSLAAL